MRIKDLNIYCKYCGNQISIDSVFCTACGKRIKEKIESDNIKQICIQCGIDLPVNHNNKRCDRCRCDNMDKVKGIGKNILLGAALVALAGLTTTETDQIEDNNDYVTGRYKCTQCASDMEYIMYEDKWQCTCCGREVDEYEEFDYYI